MSKTKKKEEKRVSINFPEENGVIMVISDISTDALVEKVAKTNIAKYIYYFSQNFQGLNTTQISRLEEAIILTKNAKYIYLFAVNSPQKDIKKLEEAIIKTQNAEYIYYFAKQFFKDINIEVFEETLKKIGSEEPIKKFNKLIPFSIKIKKYFKK